LLILEIEDIPSTKCIHFYDTVIKNVIKIVSNAQETHISVPEFKSISRWYKRGILRHCSI